MNQEIKAKLQKMIAKIEVAEGSGRKFEDFNVLRKIKSALTKEDEEKLRNIRNESFENGPRSVNSFWHYMENGEEFGQVFEKFLYPHECPKCHSTQIKK